MIKQYKILTLGCAASICLGAGVVNAAAPKPPAKNAYSLEMQAMQDVSNKTDVYVTVKPTTSGISLSGLAKHVQMKSFDSVGDLRWTKNEFDVALKASADKSGSTAQFSYNDMGRFQPVQAQVQVKTGQTTNTEVLKTKIPVFFRPDLTVSEIRVQDTVHVGEVVNIAATVNELNGDLGAKAKVVLKNAQEQLDVAEGVGVDAKGNAGVVFSTLFTAPGAYTLTVSVDSSDPGDYDTSNNQKDITINVVDNVTSVPYQMGYYYTYQDYSYTWSGWWGSGVNTWKGEVQQQWGYLDLSGRDVAYPLKATVDLRVDGKPEILLGKTVSDVNPDWTWSYGCENGTSAFRDLGDNVYFYAGTSNYCGWSSYSYVQNYQYAEDYVYFSQYHDYYWGSYTYSGAPKTGKFIRAQQSVQARFVVESANGQAFGGDMEVASLQNYAWDYPVDYWYYDYQQTGWNRGYQLYGWNYGTTQP
jgi:hypothetical protein